MPWEVPITVDGMRYPVRFNTENEPTQDEIDEAVQQITNQAPPASEKPFWKTGDVLSALGDVATNVLPATWAGVRRGWEGIQKEHSPEYMEAMAADEARNRAVLEENAKRQAAGELSTAGENIREIVPSLGFMGASIPSTMAGARTGAFTGGRAATMAGAPEFAPQAALAGGVIGGFAGGFGASYRMMGAQFMDDAMNHFNELSMQKLKRPLNDAERQEIYDDLLPVAQNTALWEAAPEAIGNLATLGAGKVILGIGKPAFQALVKSAKAKVLAGIGSQATELATEGITEFGQGNDQAKLEAYKAGLPMESVAPKYQGAQGLWEATKEVAPAVATLGALTAGAGGLAYGANKALSKAPTELSQAQVEALTARSLASAQADMDEAKSSDEGWMAKNNAIAKAAYKLQNAQKAAEYVAKGQFDEAATMFGGKLTAPNTIVQDQLNASMAGVAANADVAPQTAAVDEQAQNEPIIPTPAGSPVSPVAGAEEIPGIGAINRADIAGVSEAAPIAANEPPSPESLVGDAGAGVTGDAPEIPLADRPSPNLAPRATNNVPPRPPRQGRDTSARDVWNEQYGDMRKDGKTHNEDGTPYQPTVYDEVAPAIVAARQQMTDEEANERIGDWSETRIATSIRTLINAGWTWDAVNKQWQKPANNPVPNETPAQAIIRLQGQTQPAAAPSAPSTPQPAVAPAKQSAAEKALGLPAGTLGGRNVSQPQTTQTNALQKQSTGSVLQREQKEARKTGSERERVEPSLEGQEAAGARQGEEKVTAPNDNQTALNRSRLGGKSPSFSPKEEVQSKGNQEDAQGAAQKNASIQEKVITATGNLGGIIHQTPKEKLPEYQIRGIKGRPATDADGIPTGWKLNEFRDAVELVSEDGSKFVVFPIDNQSSYGDKMRALLKAEDWAIDNPIRAQIGASSMEANYGNGRVEDVLPKTVRFVHTTKTIPGKGQKSGYYPGTYAYESESGFLPSMEGNKFVGELPESDIYTLTDADQLKKDAADAGFGKHSGNGNAEVKYLQSLGFKAMRRPSMGGTEIIVFDTKDANFKTQTSQPITPQGKPTTATEGKVMPGGSAVKRDATKPAQMTPEEFEKVKNSLNVKRTIAQSKLAEAEAIQPSKNPAVQIKQIAKQGARKQELDDAERAFEEFYATMAFAVEDAIKNRQPFSTAAHKEIGMDYIPSGYELNKAKDLYVFKPETAESPTATRAEKTVTLKISELKTIPEDWKQAQKDKEANNERWQKAIQSKEPIRVIPYDGGYRVSDGHHRLLNAQSKGETTIEAIVEPPLAEKGLLHGITGEVTEKITKHAEKLADSLQEGDVVETSDGTDTARYKVIVEDNTRSLRQIDQNDDVMKLKGRKYLANPVRQGQLGQLKANPNSKDALQIIARGRVIRAGTEVKPKREVGETDSSGAPKLNPNAPDLEKQLISRARHMALGMTWDAQKGQNGDWTHPSGKNALELSEVNQPSSNQVNAIFNDLVNKYGRPDLKREVSQTTAAEKVEAGNAALDSLINELPPGAQAKYTPEVRAKASRFFETRNEADLQGLTSIQKTKVHEALYRSDKEAAEAEKIERKLQEKRLREQEQENARLEKERERQAKLTESRRNSLDSIIGKPQEVEMNAVSVGDGRESLAMVHNSGDVPGVLNAFVGTSKDFLANPENEKNFPGLYRLLKGGRVDEGNFAYGRAFVFTDGIGINAADRANATKLGVTPAIAAVRRVLIHESLVHRGIFGLPAHLQRKILQWVQQNTTPEQLDVLAKTYPQYADWRSNENQLLALCEEFLAKKVEKLTTISKTGPLARLMDILSDIWRWITGNTGEPTIKNLKDVVKLLKAGAEAADARLVNGGKIQINSHRLAFKTKNGRTIIELNGKPVSGPTRDNLTDFPSNKNAPVDTDAYFSSRESFDQRAASDVSGQPVAKTRRIERVTVPDKFKGIGLGKALVLAHLQQFPNTTFYNSQASPELTRALQSLNRDELIELKGDLAPNGKGLTNHTVVLTEKGSGTNPLSLVNGGKIKMSQLRAQGFVTPEMDKVYMDAVEAGDMETAQRMVDEAAKAAGYNVGPVFHRTKAEFTVFDLSKSSSGAVWGPAIYASLDNGSWNPASLKDSRVIKGYVGGKVIDLTQPSVLDLHLIGKLIGRDIDTIPLVTLERRYGSVAEGLKAAGFSAALHKGPGSTGSHIAVFDPNQIKSADPVTRDDAGNVIPLSQRFNAASPDIRASYIGEGAIKNFPEERRQFMRDSLDAAKAMAAAGKSSEEIRAATGWFPGKYDGKMRWELPDNEATFKALPKATQGQEIHISYFLHHPKLFEAYPDLKKILLEYDPDLTIQGQFKHTADWRHAKIVVGPRTKDQLSTILHEIQHWIQYKESFANGADFNLLLKDAALDRIGAINKYKIHAGEIEARDVQARQKLTSEQRKAVAPYSSENIAPEDAIVIFGNQGVQESRPTYANPIDAQLANAAERMRAMREREAAPPVPKALARLFDTNAQPTGTANKLFQLGQEAPVEEIQQESAIEPQATRNEIRAAYDRAIVGESSIQVPIQKVFDEAKSAIPSLTERDFGKQLQNLYEDGSAFLVPTDRSADMIAAGEKWGVYDAAGMPASYVGIMPAQESPIIYATPIDRNAIQSQIEESAKAPVNEDSLKSFLLRAIAMHGQPSSVRMARLDPDAPLQVSAQPNGELVIGLGVRQAGEVIRNSRSTQAGFKYLADAVEEEMIHFADLLAMRSKWEAQGKQIDFDHFIRRQSMDLTMDLMQTAETLSIADKEALRKVLAANLASYSNNPNWNNDTLENVIQAYAESPMKMNAELVRSLIQAKRSGEITATGYQRIANTIVKWLQDALDWLKRAYNQARGGSFGNVLAQRIQDTEEQLEMLGAPVEIKASRISNDVDTAIHSTRGMKGKVDNIIKELPANSFTGKPLRDAVSQSFAPISSRQFYDDMKPMVIKSIDEMVKRGVDEGDLLQAVLDPTFVEKTFDGWNPSAKVVVQQLFFAEALKRAVNKQDQFLKEKDVAGYNLQQQKIDAWSKDYYSKANEFAAIGNAIQHVMDDPDYQGQLLLTNFSSQKVKQEKEVTDSSMKDPVKAAEEIDKAGKDSKDDADEAVSDAAEELSLEDLIRDGEASLSDAEKSLWQRAKEYMIHLGAIAKAEIQAAFTGKASNAISASDLVKHYIAMPKDKRDKEKARFKKELNDVLGKLIGDKTTAKGKKKGDLVEAFEKKRSRESIKDKVFGPDEQKAFKALIRKLNAARPGETTPLARVSSWKALFEMTPTDQGMMKGRMFDTIKNDPAFDNLTPEEQQKLATLLEKAWDKRREQFLTRELDRIIRTQNMSKKAAKALEQRPAILRKIDSGVFDYENLAALVGEQYGIKNLTPQEAKRVKEISSELGKDLMPHERTKLQDELQELMVSKNLSLGEMLKAWWITAVLTGPRTAFTIGLSFMTGGFELVGHSMSVLANPKMSMQEKSAAIGDAIKNWWGSIGREAKAAWMFVLTGDKTIQDPSSLMSPQFFDKQFRGNMGRFSFSAAEKMIKSTNPVIRFMGWFMTYAGRILNALDTFNYGITKAGSAPLVYSMLKNAYKPGQMSTSKLVREAKNEIIQKGFDGEAPNASTLNAWARNLAYAKLETITGLAENMNQVAKQGNFTLEPTGFGGLIYNTLKRTDAYIQQWAEERVNRMRKDMLMGKNTWVDQRLFNAAEFVQAGLMQVLPILGLQFAKFATNSLNQTISFIPIAGLGRLKEQVDGQAVHNKMIWRNQAIGSAAFMWIYITLKAIEQEPDDEKRGWGIEGDWSNLTPQEKRQRDATGLKENTIWWRNKDGERVVLNYVNWPVRPLMAAFGSMSDQIKYAPDQWQKGGVMKRGVTTGWAMAKSVLNTSAVSQFTELFGSNIASRDPVEAFTNKAARVFGGYAGGFVPRIIKDIDRWMQPEINKYEGWEYLGKELPFYRRSIGHEYLDVFGKVIAPSQAAWSREMVQQPMEPEYRMLGRLNSRGLWLTPAVAENRLVGKGSHKRPMTDEEAQRYVKAVGQGYREMILRYGDRLLSMPKDRAKDFLAAKSDDVRDRSVKLATRPQ